MHHPARILLILLLTASLFAQGKGKGHGKGQSKGGQQSTTVGVSVIFNDADRRILQDYVRATPTANLPPGLAKRGSLPPGLEKQLRRNGTLPPGLEKRLSPFPPDLDRRLSPLPPNCNCNRVFLDGRALVIVRATQAILDVIALF